MLSKRTNILFEENVFHSLASIAAKKGNKLALSKSISFYDASYINLAQTLSLKLLTLD